MNYSIVVPLFNKAHFIECTIRSVLPLEDLRVRWMKGATSCTSSVAVRAERSQQGIAP